MLDFILSTLSWRGYHRLKACDFLNIRKQNLTDISPKYIQSIIKNPHYLNFQTKNKNWIEQSLKDFNTLKINNCSYTLIGDEDYPKELYRLPQPPLILTYKGTPCWNKAYKISVVGSRSPNPLTLNWLDQEFSQFLKQTDIVTISGGAIGIDQKVHTLSLRENRASICFLPSGLQNLYPLSLNKMSSYFIKNKGCFVSQFAPHQAIFPSHFHHRNKLIAALSSFTFVVEAKRRSGSLITAKAALDLGQDVGSLPSHPMCLSSQGSLELIQNGAHLIKDHKDLLTLINSNYFGKN